MPSAKNSRIRSSVIIKCQNGFTIINALIGGFIMLISIYAILDYGRFVSNFQKNIAHFQDIRFFNSKLRKLVTESIPCNSLFAQQTFSIPVVTTFPMEFKNLTLTELDSNNNPVIMAATGIDVGDYTISGITLSVNAQVSTSYFGALRVDFVKKPQAPSNLIPLISRIYSIQFYINDTNNIVCESNNSIRGFKTVISSAVRGIDQTYDTVFYDGNIWNGGCESMATGAQAFYLGEVLCPNNWIPTGAGFNPAMYSNPSNASFSTNLGQCSTQYSNADRNNPNRWKVFLCCSDASQAILVDSIYGTCQMF